MQYMNEQDQKNVLSCKESMKESMTKLSNDLIDHLNEILNETTVLFIDPKNEICYDNKNE